MNLIVHTLDDVNRGLTKGEYFWTDIIRGGVALLELPGQPFATPRPMTPADAYVTARGYFDQWLQKIESGL